MNRREILTGAGALAMTSCTQMPAAAADPFAGHKLMTDVDAYVGFGGHRTGSQGDLATSDWFAKYWSGLGYTIEQTDVTCPNADTHVAKLRIGDQAFEGFAQPPLTFTPEGGLNAPLAWWHPEKPADVSGRIAIVYIERSANGASPSAAYRDAFQKCAAAGALGVVAIVSGPSGEVVAINTPVRMTLGIPVLQVGEKERQRLEAGLSSKLSGKLIIEGPGGVRTGRNTMARSGDAGPWVIISTPQSGWFTCGGERGPGIAMSRALSAWAKATRYPVRWLFVATSGHEWVDHGAEIFHKTQAPGPANTALWFHLGASFGARAYDETPTGLVAKSTPNLVRSLMATPDLAPICEAAFAGQPVIDQPLPAKLATALGEYRLVLEEGYAPSAGFWGGNAHFHTPIDGASSTTPDIMEPIARAIAQVIDKRLARL
ncbi:MAG: hypothetical protein ABMA14_07830 [Hyphomonadaceae bacterium]